MRIDIISLFPEVFLPYFNRSIILRAQKKKKVKIYLHNLRDYARNRHKTVDDRPYGGGPGMILKIEPIYRALRALKVKGQKLAQFCVRGSKVKNKELIIMLDPAGKIFDQRMAKKFSKYHRLVFLCGRYEGFDERVKEFVDERISIGNYVLTGGELPAMVIIDAVVRLIPSVLGKKEALAEETHAKRGYIEYPQYTRPAIFKIKGKELKVPRVLLSGDHQKIKAWREKHSGFKFRNDCFS
jgi:tRNA (guanine37-N1)-methyltransferase